MTMTTAGPLFTEAAFWHQPLRARMAQFADLREQGPFVHGEIDNIFTGTPVGFHAATRYAEIAEISRRPLDFCSGRGTTSISDVPADAMEFFGSIIAMDDPRHARQRGVVARKFTPRQLQGLLDSVEVIATEVIDGICERGEVDLVEAVSEPFPLLVICDMIGIPRSEFSTVLRCTNVILGAGDAEALDGRTDVVGAILEAGQELATLFSELAQNRKQHPADDLTSALVNSEVGDDWLTPEELSPFFILLTTAGNDTTRNAISHGMNLLAEHPDQRALWQADPEGLAASAVEEIIRASSPVTFMRRTVTHDLTIAGQDFSEGDKIVLFYGAANRDPRVFADPEGFDVRRNPNPHMGFGGPGPHFCLGAHLARRELAVIFRQLFKRLPDFEVSGEPAWLQANGIPLVGGIKRLPVRLSPAARVGRTPSV